MDTSDCQPAAVSAVFAGTQVRSWQIIEATDSGATLENRVDLGLGKVRAIADCKATSDERTEVRISNVFAEGLWQKLPIGGQRDDVGHVDWLYVDERIRITRGSRGSLCVHIREA
jgi:hypothetical protein